ncbi:hypothetical protein MIND_00397700 [Mycena indigotica]|uniref:Uncharacterized protein n=1 Tax=Mycena indigotica TaxID=2126181 RepID=A0A8H6T6C3_9AGAR|nr:uncharacterized protein MIND_00397700 [Mycena indigotica]KAF7310240.1 hypothetical protein MIND_00397700 [Mycena indigotica]
MPSHRPTPSLPLVLLSLSPILYPSVYAATNTTFDDAHPSFAFSSHWKAVSPAFPCTGCLTQPDPAQTLDGTWHDGNVFATATDVRWGSFTFTGHAVYIYGIDELNSEPDIVFTLDGAAAGTHHYAGPGAGTVYHALYFARTGLSEETHTVSWELRYNTASGVDQQVALFDYAMVTTGAEAGGGGGSGSGSVGGAEAGGGGGSGSGSVGGGGDETSTPTKPEESVSAGSGSGQSLANHSATPVTSVDPRSSTKAGLNPGLSASTNIGQKSLPSTAIPPSLPSNPESAACVGRNRLGTILGTIFGVIVLIALLLGLFLRRRFQKKNKTSAPPPVESFLAEAVRDEPRWEWEKGPSRGLSLMRVSLPASPLAISPSTVTMGSGVFSNTPSSQSPPAPAITVPPAMAHVQTERERLLEARVAELEGDMQRYRDGNGEVEREEQPPPYMGRVSQ